LRGAGRAQEHRSFPSNAIIFQLDLPLTVQSRRVARCFLARTVPQLVGRIWL